MTNGEIVNELHHRTGLPPSPNMVASLVAAWDFFRSFKFKWEETYRSMQHIEERWSNAKEECAHLLDISDGLRKTDMAQRHVLRDWLSVMSADAKPQANEVEELIIRTREVLAIPDPNKKSPPTQGAYR